MPFIVHEVTAVNAGEPPGAIGIENGKQLLAWVFIIPAPVTV